MISGEFNKNNRLLKRAGFFQGIAAELKGGYPELFKKSHFPADAPSILARCYFLLSDCYKLNRNKQNHLTDDHKKAGVTALAVMAIRPIIPLDPENIEDQETHLANPIYAEACAMAWLGTENIYSPLSFDYQKKLLNILQHKRVEEGLNEFLQAVRTGNDLENITAINLNASDLTVIDEMVFQFYMLDKLSK